MGLFKNLTFDLNKFFSPLNVDRNLFLGRSTIECDARRPFDHYDNTVILESSHQWDHDKRIPIYLSKFYLYLPNRHFSWRCSPDKLADRIGHLRLIGWADGGVETEHSRRQPASSYPRVDPSNFIVMLKLKFWLNWWLPRSKYKHASHRSTRGSVFSADQWVDFG